MRRTRQQLIKFDVKRQLTRVGNSYAVLFYGSSTGGGQPPPARRVPATSS